MFELRAAINTITIQWQEKITMQHLTLKTRLYCRLPDRKSKGKTLAPLVPRGLSEKETERQRISEP